MPKMVGRNPSDVGRPIEIVDEVPETYVRLQYQQLSRLAEAVEVRAVLDTSDRGGPGRLAKRWYAWYADAQAILSSPESTPTMRARAQSRLAEWHEHLALSDRARAAGRTRDEQARVERAEQIDAAPHRCVPLR